MKKIPEYGEYKMQAAGIKPIRQQTLTAEELANELLGLDYSLGNVHKRLSVPLSLETTMRLSLIAENYEYGLGKLAAVLIDIALPQLEEKLEITVEDICNYFNSNKPSGFEDANALPIECLTNNEAMKKFLNQVESKKVQEEKENE